MRHPDPRPRARVLAVGLGLTAAAILPSGLAGASDKYQWAALGDSFTTGVFVGEPRPALGDASRDGCDRTANAYPDLVDRALAASPPGKPVRLTDVSCSGATVADIATTRQTPISPVQPPAGGWSALDQQTTRAELGDGTDVVTIGIGANDLPFGVMLLKCLELGHAGRAGRSCRDYYTDPPEGEASIRDRLDRLQDEFIGMLAKVHRAAPNAKVITVGYPAVLPEKGSACTGGDPTQLGSITADDINWLRDEVLAPLNRTIQRVSKAFGDRYVDVHASSVGHDACRPEETRWVEGLCGNAEDHWPGSFLNCAAIDKRTTLAHPNAAGYADTAAHVERAIRDALLEH
ncbi:SGNH/GDSL hydrolase family protein [Kitasatospora sp. NPDC057541]|uniref:SGNH/GDSL hydrolase family protein n=1 Tax=unclassified Kitasatospora TaxID=2633591 RepID=UPI003683E165